MILQKIQRDFDGVNYQFIPGTSNPNYYASANTETEFFTILNRGSGGRNVVVRWLFLIKGQGQGSGY
jgi:hypothetical protein